MDISVFNLLMSTTPTVSGAETAVGGTTGEANAGVQAAQMQKSMKTGEAFLKVLEEVRNGKTEKSAESFFHTISARADASSSLKNFKTNEKTDGEVKVVRLHIKRTRASEKLQKAEENAPANAETAQDRQKIPAGENTAVLQQAQSAVPQENGVPENTERAAEQFPAVSEQTGEPAENDPVFSEELTAADILVGAAVQASAVRPAEAVRVSPDDPSRFDIRETAQEQLQPLVHDETAAEPADQKTVQSIEPVPAAAQTEQTAVPAEQNLSLPSNEESLPRFGVTKTDEAVPVAKAEGTERNDGFVSIKEADAPEKRPVFEKKETAAATPARERQDLNREELAPQTPAESAETAFETKDFSVSDQKESRRQADRLAAALPAGVKIAVAVETNKPAGTLFRPVQTVNEKNPAAKKTAAEDNQDADLFLPEPPAPPEKEEAAEAVKVKTSAAVSARPQIEKQPEGNATPQYAALPVEQKSLAANIQATAAGTENAVNAANANASNAPAGHAFIPAGQELKGKAVSGTAALPKHVPVNELADQIKVNIKKALKAGLDKIDVVLKHKELGTIKVHLEIDKDGNMKAVLSTARTETLDLLRADLQGLKQALADSGFNMNDEAFSFNYRGERYDGGREQNEQRQNGGRVYDEEDENQSRPVSEIADYSERYALNIRV